MNAKLRWPRASCTPICPGAADVVSTGEPTIESAVSYATVAVRNHALFAMRSDRVGQAVNSDHRQEQRKRQVGGE